MNAALELFSFHGYNATTTKRIAQMADVNEVTIFRYFENKETLLECIIKRFVEDTSITEELEKGFKNDLEADIKHACQLYCRFMYENDHIFRLQLKLSDSYTEKFTTSTKIKNIISDHFRILFKKMIIDTDPEFVSTLIVSSIIGSCLVHNLSLKQFSPITPEERSTLIADYLYKSLNISKSPYADQPTIEDT